MKRNIDITILVRRPNNTSGRIMIKGTYELEGATLTEDEVAGALLAMEVQANIPSRNEQFPSIRVHLFVNA